MSAFAVLSTRHDWAQTTDADWAGVMAQMPLFAQLGKRQWRKVTRHAAFAAFVPGDIVLPENAPADFFYVVLGGEAEVRDAVRARRVGPGDYFGEAALLNADRSASVVATDELDVMRLPGRDFVRLVQGSPRVAAAMLRDLGGRVQRRENQQLFDAA
jgi:CRP-like cAMP-binding protein